MAEEQAAGAEAEQESVLRVVSILIEGVSLKVFSFPDRRSGRANPPVTQWVFQKQLEELFFARSDGGSSNPIWKALQSHDVGSTSLLCQKATVVNRHLLQSEYDTMLLEFRSVSRRSTRCRPTRYADSRSSRWAWPRRWSKTVGVPQFP